MDFELTDVLVEEWGKLQVVIGGRDLTEWAGIPTIVGDIVYREPFSEARLSLFFPSITPFMKESTRYSSGSLVGGMPFAKFDDVEIHRVSSTGEYITTKFEGMVVSYTDDLSANSSGIEVECIGCLYQADFFVKTPNFNDEALDIGDAIRRDLNDRIDNYGLRLAPLGGLAWANIPSRSQGSWNKLLSGHIQDMLSISYSNNYWIADETAIKLTTIENENWTGLMATGDFGTHLNQTSPTSKANWEKLPYYGAWSWIVKYAKGLAILAAPEDTTYGYPGGSEVIQDVTQRPQGDGFWYVNRGGRVWGAGAAGGWGNGAAWQSHEETVQAGPYGDLYLHDSIVQSIASTITGEGYYLLDEPGVVHEFGDAVHYGNGSTLGPRSGEIDFWVDMQLTPSGSGYWLLSNCGRIEEFGDAAAMADAPFPAPNGGGINITNGWRKYTEMAVNPLGDGLWVLAGNGYVYEAGNAANFSDIDMGDHLRAISISSNSLGGYAVMRIDGYLWTRGSHWAGSQTFQRNINANFSSWPDVYQWTVRKKPGRVVGIVPKNEWDKRWSVVAGQPGVTHSLTRDWSSNPNTYYGEGITPENCRWRNAKYPNIQVSAPPLWPGYYITTELNAASDGTVQWERAMYERGWNVNRDGTYTGVDEKKCKDFQAQAGIAVDGVIGPQTWNATFGVGESIGSIDGAYYAPIAVDRRVDPYTYTPNGRRAGYNPNWSRNLVRIEGYDNYGEGITKEDATISAMARLKRDSEVGWYGTITLTTDPLEGSRFDIGAGENIVYRGYRDLGSGAEENVKFHISEVSVDWQNLTVTLQVDTSARDAMTLHQMIERDKEAFDPTPARVRTRFSSQAKTTEDRISTWDCENGAGIIPKLALGAGIWQVIKIPVGEYGQVMETVFQTDIPAEFAIGIFDTEITANELQGLGSPVDATAFWDNIPWYHGIVIAWGGFGQMAGYSPGVFSDGATLTGLLRDRGAWNFWTTKPPWIWVAMYCTQTTFIQGKLTPGMEAPGVRPLPRDPTFLV